MRSGLSTSSTLLDGGSGLAAFARRQAERLGGAAMIAAAVAAVGALATWNVADPSFSHATDNPVTNALGYPGAVYADIAMQFFGLAALITLLPLIAWGILFAAGCCRPGRLAARRRLVRRKPAGRRRSRLRCAVIGLAIANRHGWRCWRCRVKLPALMLGGYPAGLAAVLIMAALSAPGLYALAFAWLFGRRASNDDMLAIEAGENEERGRTRR